MRFRGLLGVLLFLPALGLACGDNEQPPNGTNSGGAGGSGSSGGSGGAGAGAVAVPPASRSASAGATATWCPIPTHASQIALISRRRCKRASARAAPSPCATNISCAPPDAPARSRRVTIRTDPTRRRAARRHRPSSPALPRSLHARSTSRSASRCTPSVSHSAARRRRVLIRRAAPPFLFERHPLPLRPRLQRRENVPGWDDLLDGRNHLHLLLVLEVLGVARGAIAPWFRDRMRGTARRSLAGASPPQPTSRGAPASPPPSSRRRGCRSSRRTPSRTVRSRTPGR
jgi:hypothetical protein